MGSEKELESNYVDYCIGSVEHIRKFLENMETADKITNSGQLGYIKAILKLLPKISGFASQNFTTFLSC